MSRFHLLMTAGLLVVGAAANSASAVPLTGLQLHVSADQGVFSDAAGTTPAAVGGTVALWQDQSTNGRKLLQDQQLPTLVAIDTNGDSVADERALRFSGAQSLMGFESNGTSPYLGPGGAGVTGFTMFIVARAATTGGYSSILRFQDDPPTYVVYPWSDGNQSAIISSDGGTGAGLGSGLDANEYNIGSMRYEQSTTNGFQTMDTGTIVNQRNSGAGAIPTEQLFVGRYNGGSEYANADVLELIVYNRSLSDAERSSVESELGAKYGIAVPEPTSLSLVALGGITLLRRRRTATA